MEQTGLSELVGERDVNMWIRVYWPWPPGEPGLDAAPFGGVWTTASLSPFASFPFF